MAKIQPKNLRNTDESRYPFAQLVDPVVKPRGFGDFFIKSSLNRILLFLLCAYPLISFENPTEIKFYRPFGAVVDQVEPKIIAHKQGMCSQQSTRIVREEAWRCVADGVTYDPCFVKPAGDKNKALCLESPWRDSAVLVITESPLETNNQKTLDVSTAYPWAVLLTTGEHCLSTDKDQMLDGSLVHYQCPGKTILFGHLQRCKNEWTILKQNRDGFISTVSIKKAWF